MLLQNIIDNRSERLVDRINSVLASTEVAPDHFPARIFWS
jgi:hypothetical protein